MPEQSDTLLPTSMTAANTDSMVLSEVEARVAKIWAEALERSDVIGAEDSFFALGGDSLSMMIVLFQVGEQLGVELSQAALLEAPSLRQFCAVLEKARDESKS
jgi:acyl carrier protein